MRKKRDITELALTTRFGCKGQPAALGYEGRLEQLKKKEAIVPELADFLLRNDWAFLGSEDIEEAERVLSMLIGQFWRRRGCSR